jgi:hypothetical protein
VPRHHKILLLALSCAVAVYLISPVTDADLGWHLRYGDYFWNTGTILKANTFSWSLPDYQWANHSWGYDIILSKLFSWGEFTLLSSFGAILIGLSYFIALSAKIATPSLLLPTSLFLLINKELLNTGLKSNYLSLLFSAILVYALHKYHRQPHPSGYYLITLLMLLWSNLHGQFILGIAFILIYTLYAIKINHNRNWWTGVSILSIAATFINPWGIALWSTSLSHSQADTLAYIFEWMPWEWSQPLSLILIGYMAWLWWNLKRFKGVSLPHLIIFGVVSLLALRARRFISLYMLLSLPLASALIKPKHWSLITAGFILFYIATFPSKTGLNNQSWERYCATYLQCSEAALGYFRQNSPQGNIFNAYSLGGHLIYRLPTVLPYIDGRMTLWQDLDKSYPFLTYYSVIHAHHNPILWLMQQNIQYVMLQPQFELTEKLRGNQWPEVFSDGQVSIFKNPTF